MLEIDKSEILFNSKVVEVSRYRKFKWANCATLFVLILAGIAIFFMMIHRVLDNLNQPRPDDWWTPEFLFILLSVIIVTVLVIAVYSDENKLVSKMNLYATLKGIGFYKAEVNKFFKFNQMENLKIHRGATYHYDFKYENHLHKMDNFVLFDYKNKHHKYEFIIDDMEQNNAFEKMVAELKKECIEFEYKTV